MLYCDWPIQTMRANNFESWLNFYLFSEDGSYGYKDSLIHRIVPSGWIQGGDIIDGSKGDAGKSSLSDGAAFPDESFSISHDSRGVLSMANCGPHTNQSQFFVTLEAKRNLDRRFVAFGRVIRGSSVQGSKSLVRIV